MSRLARSVAPLSTSNSPSSRKRVRASHWIQRITHRRAKWALRQDLLLQLQLAEREAVRPFCREHGIVGLCLLLGKAAAEKRDGAVGVARDHAGRHRQRGVHTRVGAEEPGCGTFTPVSSVPITLKSSVEICTLLPLWQ
jgi:hypothetical protein